MCPDWFKVVFLWLDRNKELPWGNDGMSKENLPFDDQSKQIKLLSFCGCGIFYRNRKHVLHVSSKF